MSPHQHVVRRRERKERRVGAGSPETLVGWKAIAGRMGVTPRTAQMWERKLRLPVRRFPGRKGHVFAFVAELDGWTRPEPQEVARRAAVGWLKTHAVIVALASALPLSLAALYLLVR